MRKLNFDEVTRHVRTLQDIRNSVFDLDCELTLDQSLTRDDGEGLLLLLHSLAEDVNRVQARVERMVRNGRENA